MHIFKNSKHSKIKKVNLKNYFNIFDDNLEIDINIFFKKASTWNITLYTVEYIVALTIVIMIYEEIRRISKEIRGFEGFVIDE